MSPRRPDTGRLSVLGFRLGWRVVRVLPERAAYALFDRVADVLHRRGGRGVQRLRDNYATVRPELDDRELEQLVRRGLRSYFRYWCESFRLPDRSAADLAEQVQARGDAPVRAALAQGRGVVGFLGHLGNWDLAGAWAAHHLAPVTTVAERLEPEELYQQFLDYRTSIGITIHPLGGEGNVFGGLVRTLRDGGFVPLLSDRDLTSRGVEVDFCGHRARMAAGPAALALATGACVTVVDIHYEPRPGARPRLVIQFLDEVHDPGTGTSRERIAVMTQRLATQLEGVVREHTEDWHMMQRVFLHHLDPARTPAPASGVQAAADPGRGTSTAPPGEEPA